MSSNTSSDRYPLIPLAINPLLQSIDDDPQNLFVVDMTLIHNAFIRGVNSIWRNAPLVKPADARSFAGYCLTLLEAIHGHHSGEEAFIFPFLATKLDMGHNLEQHEAFHGPIEEFKAYMESVQAEKETYDGERARGLVEAFGQLLVTHLHDEIPTISPERMKAFDDDKAGLKKMMEDLQEHIKTRPGKMTVFPFVMCHHNIKEAPNWPPAPTAIKWFARNIAPYFHYSYWKFSPFTPHGVPQTLYGTA
ncbi:hypothetical protein CPB84DRAFT_1678772 [Gymnopilus junonius]|uniref:Hemerythrin-like domain-containing protein n=1 Tax=Gymnopilus junonius TaxID=109634 RepID=A0A9P5NQ41_GYMJU|nr:hypothetical protein CPB84DRAFT_1678772 [Gymnopilus junonius]